MVLFRKQTLGQEQEIRFCGRARGDPEGLGVVR